MDSLAWFVSAVGRLLGSAFGPIMLGLFGGAGATILWEGVLKPRRISRSLAHVLADEVSHNAKVATAHHRLMKKAVENFPGDFTLSTIVFESVCAQIGELRDLSADIVLFYEHVRAVQRIPGLYDEAAADFASDEPRSAATHKRALRTMEFTRVAMMDGCEALGRRAAKLAPKLRRASVPAWRLYARRQAAARPPFDEAELDAVVKSTFERYQARADRVVGKPSSPPSRNSV